MNSFNHLVTQSVPTTWFSSIPPFPLTSSSNPLFSRLFYSSNHLFSTNHLSTRPSSSSSPPPPSYQWAVIGAGPAGIASIGLLLDTPDISPHSILWVDPSFSVGDFGVKWKSVSSNTTVSLFLRFYHHCRSFEFGKDRKQYIIETMDKHKTCLLELAAEPLRDITRNLREKVVCVEGEVVQIRQKNAKWELRFATSSPSYITSNVILATGGIPHTFPFHLPYPMIQEISIAEALNPTLLTSLVTPNTTIAIFGSSHTAIILIRNLLEKTKVKHVINFYKEPLKYALYMDDWILFDDTGLKGDTAKWSRENLHGELPPRLTRVLSDDTSIAKFLPLCDKVIYATGFKRKDISEGIEGLPPHPNYNPHCGILAPGLFGCGIGYPEQKTDCYGNVEMRVGLWKFMEYLERIIPLWKRYSVSEGIGEPPIKKNCVGL